MAVACSSVEQNCGIAMMLRATNTRLVVLGFETDS
jgi:hypothetical protein